MILKHYGNACFSLFNEDSKGKLHFLFDPWIEAPAVGGGWVHFPPSQAKIEDLPKIDYIFISHIHSDHCELKTMEKLDRSIPIIILEREPNFLKKYLEGLGFNNLILVPKEKKTQIHGRFHVELFGESFGHLCSNIIDSSILFEFENGTVLNCNDNKPSPDLCAYIKKRYSQLDLALIPAGGGSGYPAMYENYRFEEKLEISKKIVDQYAKVFTEAVDILKPSVVVPVAGGFAIRGIHNPEVNWVQCRRLNMLEVSDYYSRNSTDSSQTRVLPLQPGMELSVSSRSYISGQYKVWSELELKDHFEKLSREPIEGLIKTEVKMKNLGRLVSLARNEMWKKQQKNGMKPDYRIYFDIPNYPRLIEISLSEDQTQEISRSESELMKAPYLKMKLDQDTLLEWLLGLEDYNMLDSGHRISFWREPIQLYVQEVYYLMSLLRLA